MKKNAAVLNNPNAWKEAKTYKEMRRVISIRDYAQIHRGSKAGAELRNSQVEAIR